MPQQPVRYTPDIKKGLQSSQVEDKILSDDLKR